MFERELSDEWLFKDRAQLPCEAMGQSLCRGMAACVCASLGLEPAVAQDYDPSGSLWGKVVGEAVRTELTSEEIANITEVKKVWATQPEGWMPGPELGLQERRKIFLQHQAYRRAQGQPEKPEQNYFLER